MWQWTQTRERAAVLLMEGRLKDREIAAELGISRSTLSRWKLVAAFRRRIDALFRAERRLSQQAYEEHRAAQLRQHYEERRNRRR